ncbi:MAG: carboxypeptidase regulatory-like domain-containing protein, partial [Planctomycetota bacterium]|nr:carboxypeptidase regulatory-like domain-containing protein [Planctomycetota bacterium]
MLRLVPLFLVVGLGLIALAVALPEHENGDGRVPAPEGREESVRREPAPTTPPELEPPDRGARTPVQPRDPEEAAPAAPERTSPAPATETVLRGRLRLPAGNPADESSRIVVRTFCGPISVRPDPANVWLEGGAGTEPIRCAGRFGSQNYDFPDVPPGDYTVVIDDPSFVRWESDGVRPGQKVDAHLKGNAAIRLRVLDRHSGLPVPSWSLSLRKDRKRVGRTTYLGSVVRLKSRGEEPPEDGRFDSLVPWDYTLLLDAPGYPSEAIPVPGLAAHEERLVEISLSRLGEIAGVVRSSDGAPVAGAAVELFRAEVLDDKRISWWTDWGSGSRDPHEITTTTADDQGRFRLATSAGGALVVRAVGGPGLHVLREVTHVAGEKRDGFDLVLPAAAYVAGRVLAPSWASLEGMKVRAGPRRSIGTSLLSSWWPGLDYFLEADLRPDGGFRIGPLSPGWIRLGLVRTARLPDGSMPNPMTLVDRTFEIAGPGDHAVDLDLVSTWPGEMLVRVQAEGDPAAGLQVTLWRQDGEHSVWMCGQTDEQGRARFQPHAGTYRVDVQGWLWSWEDPARILVQPGQTSETIVSVPALRAELLLLDAGTGAPLTYQEVTLVREYENSIWRHSLRPDTD